MILKRFLPVIMVLGFGFIAAILLILQNQASIAENEWAVFSEIEEDFETVTGFLQSSIEEEGLSIANRGNVSDMLARTKDAVGGSELLYKRAEIFEFCSAKLGHKIFAINPKNLAACPLTIVVYELKTNPGIVYIGYRRAPSMISGADKIFSEVDALLARIVKGAIE